MTELETVQLIVIAVALSAVCGLRVFVPPLFLSIATQLGWISVAGDFQWMATPEAAFAFGAAVLLEVSSYYIPVLDNLFDTIASPLAVVAGSVIAASQLFGIELFAEQPVAGWAVAVIAGGGLAGIIQAVTVAVRAVSTSMTAGLGNAVVATLELIGSIVFAVLSVVVPFVAVTLLIGFILLGMHTLIRHRYRKKSGDSAQV